MVNRHTGHGCFAGVSVGLAVASANGNVGVWAFGRDRKAETLIVTKLAAPWTALTIRSLGAGFSGNSTAFARSTVGDGNASLCGRAAIPMGCPVASADEIMRVVNAKVGRHVANALFAVCAATSLSKFAIFTVGTKD